MHFSAPINFVIDFDQVFVRIFGNFWYESIRNTQKNGFMLGTKFKNNFQTVLDDLLLQWKFWTRKLFCVTINYYFSNINWFLQLSLKFPVFGITFSQHSRRNFSTWLGTFHNLVFPTILKVKMLQLEQLYISSIFCYVEFSVRWFLLAV